MDAQDQKKNSPSEHEGHGVHLCHKCGWPFPNPHPSAKHRRAHKKVCGKVEGYQMNHSESGHLSDDEHLSDDDMRTPSPKMEKGITKELGSSGGSGLLRSHKSEDDVFSDAVTEFSDSGFSPSVEGSLDRTSPLENNVEKGLAYDLIENPQIKDDGTDGITKVLDDSTKGREEAVGNPITQSENIKPVSHIQVEEISVGVDEQDGQPNNSSLIASENIMKNIDMNGDSEKKKELIPSESQTDVEVKENMGEVECGTGCTTEGPRLESTLDDFKEKGSKNVVLDGFIPEEDRKTLDTAILEPHLHESDLKIVHSVTGGEMAVQEKEPSMLVETGNVILEPVLDKADENNSSAVFERKQDQEQINVLQADITERDLSFKIKPLENTDGSGTSPVETDSSKDILEHCHSNLAEDYDSKGEGGKETLLVSVSESLPVIENPNIMTQEFKDYRFLKSSFPLDLGNVEVTRPVQSDEKVVSEPDPNSILSITSSHSDVSSSENLEKGVLQSVVEVDPFGLQVISGRASVASDSETQHTKDNHCPEGFESKFNDEKSSPNEISVPHTGKLSDAIPTGSSIDEAKTNSTEFENAEDTVMNDTDSSITESRMSNSFHEVKSLTSQKNVDEVNMEAAQGLQLGFNDLSLKGSLDTISEFCPEDHGAVSGKEPEILINAEAQKSIIAEDQDELPKKNSEDSVFEDPVALPVASVKQSPTAVEDMHVKDLMASEPLITEADDKLTIENFSVSAVDDSIVSSSRTESLEGNWGSVSVLSTQSDGTALTDAEVLATGAHAPEKSGGTSLKPQTATGVYHPDKSDVYEPPSFMTLVDSRPELDKTVGAAEIETAQKTELSKSEAVQAGWIPSITNVMNESEGRKKNEEIIAKVTNWSSGKQHSPLKNLLNEAQAETKVKTATEKLQLANLADETASRNNGSEVVTTVSSIMGSETPVHDAAKREMEKEWNSPARYRTEIKKEKKKGKPYWVPFVCCTSVHQDM